MCRRHVLEGLFGCDVNATLKQNLARSAAARLPGGASGRGTGMRCGIAPSDAAAIGRKVRCDDLIGSLRRCWDDRRRKSFRIDAVFFLRRGTVGLRGTRRGDGGPAHPPLVPLVLRGRRGARADRRCLLRGRAAGRCSGDDARVVGGGPVATGLDAAYQPPPRPHVGRRRDGGDAVRAAPQTFGLDQRRAAAGRAGRADQVGLVLMVT